MPINFADITDIAIPAGDVTKITRQSDGAVLWEKNKKGWLLSVCPLGYYGNIHGTGGSIDLLKEYEHIWPNTPESIKMDGGKICAFDVGSVAYRSENNNMDIYFNLEGSDDDVGGYWGVPTADVSFDLVSGNVGVQYSSKSVGDFFTITPNEKTTFVLDISGKFNAYNSFFKTYCKNNSTGVFNIRFSGKFI